MIIAEAEHDLEKRSKSRVENKGFGGNPKSERRWLSWCWSSGSWNPRRKTVNFLGWVWARRYNFYYYFILFHFLFYFTRGG